MQVEVGPVPSASAIAWIQYARAVLAGYGLRGEKVEVDVGADIAGAFRAYLDDWEHTARRGTIFRWSTDVDAELVQYLVHAFYRVAERLATAAEIRGVALMPPEAEPFYAALVHGLLDGLSEAGGTMAHFADELRRFWPGYPLDER